MSCSFCDESTQVTTPGTRKEGVPNRPANPSSPKGPERVWREGCPPPSPSSPARPVSTLIAAGSAAWHSWHRHEQGGVPPAAPLPVPFLTGWESAQFSLSDRTRVSTAGATALRALREPFTRPGQRASGRNGGREEHTTL
ncbi:hypothetical protein SKAU_G00108890 [Synaphobranchus kaupii]|uniref:Uncharacterized protein n=1 Tax=Synaphobranchus kaupii TaxID=118154 RepID=A0A9Q1J853_SYNKA|nr:hypothetical protein SKAU_G00108890 [Synaphobranchus kaupii]